MTNLFTQIPAYSQRVETTITVAVAGQRAFFAGRDAYLDPGCILDVLVDGSPAAYVPMGRQVGGFGQTWPQPSTANISRGIYLNNPCAGGETVTVTYTVRILHAPAPVPCPVYAPGGVIPSPGSPNSFINFRYNGPFPPNALLLPMIQGLQIEVWRKTKKGPKSRTSSLGTDILRSGRHFSPFWRTPVALTTETIASDPFFDGWATSTTANFKSQYRIAYFDPTSGARTLLSTQKIVVLNTMAGNRPDRIGTIGTLHPRGALWVV